MAVIQEIKKGDTLLAEGPSGYNVIVREINKIQQASNPPRQSDAPRGEPNTGTGEPEDPTEEPDDITQGESPVTATATIWTETSRTTSTVRIEDPNDSEVFVEVDRIDTVSFVDSQGNTQKLVFNNT